MSTTTPEIDRSATPGLTVEIPVAAKGKAIAAVAAAVGVVPVVLRFNTFTLIFALLCLCVAARIAFGMTVRGDESGISVPRLFGTAHIPREDLMGVHYGAVASIGRAPSAPSAPTLMIFGRNYEAFAVPFHEHAAERSAQFAKDMQEFFELTPTPADLDSFETARRLHKLLTREDTELGRSLGVALGLVAAGSHFTSQILLGTSPIWMLPFCVAVFGCAAWFGRRFWRSYTNRVAWDAYW